MVSPVKLLGFGLAVAMLAATVARAGDPLLIHLEYQLSGLNAAQEEVLKKAAQLVAGYLQGTVSVKRRVDEWPAFYLPQTCRAYLEWYSPVSTRECVEVDIPQSCGGATHVPNFFGNAQLCSMDEPNQCTTNAGGTGVPTPGAQLLLYVTSIEEDGCGGDWGELAYAIACVRDEEGDKRPLAGNVNVCPSGVPETVMTHEFDQLVDTIVHEVFHVLGFSPDLFPGFVDSNGNQLPESEIFKDENGVLSLVTPKVVEMAKAHFGCPTMTSVPLEAEGGEGTSRSHWPTHLFGSRELMVPTVSSERAVISDITLALLEDSGWYDVNYTRNPIGLFGFGKDLGCSLVESCTSETSKYYCTEDQIDEESVCTWDAYAGGTCASDKNYGDGCTTIKPFANVICRSLENMDRGFDPQTWGQFYGMSSRCLPIAKEPETWEVNVDVVRTYMLDIGGSSGCFHVMCTDDGQLRVSMGNGRDVDCPAGGFVDASSIDPTFTRGKIGPCPNATDICPYLGCENDCNTHGDCYEGTCYCYLGFMGPSCEYKLV